MSAGDAIRRILDDPALTDVQSEQSVIVGGYGAAVVNNAPASIPTSGCTVLVDPLLAPVSLPLTGNGGVSVTTPLLAGYLFDISGSYQSTFRIITGMALVGFSLLISLRHSTGAKKRI